MRLNKPNKDPKIFMGTTKSFRVSPMNATCKTGSRIGREYSRGDITIIRKGIPNSMTHMNSHILRSALLNSPDVVAEVLGLQVYDVRVEENSEGPEWVRPETPEPKPKAERKIIEPDFITKKSDKKAEDFTANELKGLMDERSIEYPVSATKTRLIKIAKEHNLV